MAARSPKRTSSFPDPAAARPPRPARAVWLPLIAATALALAPPPSALAGAAVAADRATSGDAEPLLLALQVEGVPLDVVLASAERGGRVLLPLGELFRAVGVAVEMGPEDGVAAGFFITEQRRFRIDARAREIRVGATVFPWDSLGIDPRPDDLYVAGDLLGQWFGLECTFKPQAAAVAVRAGELLPIQARAARARRIQQSLTRSDDDGPETRRIGTPYRLASIPFVDQSFHTSRAQRDRQSASDWQASTYATADLLYMETDVHLAGNRRDPFAGLRAGAGRRDPRPVLLGPLHARQFRIGDVSDPGLALVARPTSGPGFFVSNFPLQRPTRFDEHDFHGRLAPGWDVELYRGDALIDYQTSGPDGTYRFDAVPLSFGFNEFRLVFNGPHGERREEGRVFNVDPSLVPLDVVHYRVVASGLTGTSPRVHVETDFGLARNLSGSFALATLRRDDHLHVYGTTGVRGYWSRLLAGADFAVDTAGGGAMEFDLEGRSRHVRAGVRHAEVVNGFGSEAFTGARGPVRRRTVARLDGVLGLHPSLRIPLQVQVASEEQSGGYSVRSLANHASLAFRRIAISHQVRGAVTHGPGVPAEPDLRSTVLASVRVRNWGLRGAIDYVPRAAVLWRDARFTAEGPAFGGLYAGFGVARDPLAHDTRVTADLRSNRGPVDWTARVEIRSDRRFTLSLALSMGLNREPRDGSWHAHSRSVARGGAASAQVFLDANGNGTRDAGEEPLAGVGLVVNRANSPKRTDGDGVIFLSGLPAESEVDLQLATDSFEDPLWISPLPGLRLAPRPGRTAMVDFPVVVSGEVAGTVSVRREGRTSVAPGVLLELVRDDGVVVRQVATAYDGFFDLLAIPPGRYRLRVAASQLRRFGLSVAPSRPIEVPPTGTMLDGVDLVLGPEPVPDPGP